MIRLEEIRKRSNTCAYGDDIQTASQDVHDLLSEMDRLKEQNIELNRVHDDNRAMFTAESKKVIRLEAGNKELKKQIGQSEEIWKLDVKEIESLESKLKEAEKGLDYYADEKMYKKDSDGDIPLMVDCGPVFAQRILKSIRIETRMSDAE